MKHLISGLTKLTATSILVASLVACGGAEERKIKYLEKGKAYLADKNYDKAKIEIKNVLQIDPKYAEAYYLMGKLDEANKELGRALNNYTKAIELDPGHTDAKLKLAKIYVIVGTEDYIKKANKLILQVKQENPNSAEAELIDATILYKTGSKSSAIERIEKVVAKEVRLVEGISLLASIYLADGNENKAINLLTKGVSNNEDNIYLRISLAKILAKNNDFIGAEKYLKEAINIEPDEFKLQVAIATFYATSDQVNKAESVLRKSIEQNPEDVRRYLVLVELLASKMGVSEAEKELSNAVSNNPELYDLKFAQVKFYEKLGKRDEAKKGLKLIISNKSYDIEGVKARNYMAKILLEEGNQKGAKTYLDEVIAEYPNNNDALFLISKLALANSDSIAAINGLRTVVKNDPKNSEASLLLAQAHELNNESSLAENELKKAMEANPINDQTHVNYARYLGSKGRMEEAVSIVDKALVYFKDSYDLMNLKLKTVASQGKDSELLALLDMMEQSKPNKDEVNIYKGQYFLSKHENVKAIEQFEKAYTKSRDKYKALQLIVKTYMASGQSDKALSRLQQNLDKNPDDSIANLLMGQIYQSQKKIEEAREKFMLASKAAESWFPPYSSLASTYVEEKNLEEAIRVYLDAEAKLKNKVPAQLQLASIYERQKDFTKAMNVYKGILAENSNNKLAANNYASLLLDHGDKADIAMALELSKSFEKVSQPAFQDTLGWAYAKSGDNVKAVEMLKSVVEKSPKVAVFRYHLGFALYHAGDKAAAKSHLEIAVSSKQSFSGKDKAIELLKTI